MLDYVKIYWSEKIGESAIQIEPVKIDWFGSNKKKLYLVSTFRTLTFSWFCFIIQNNHKKRKKNIDSRFYILGKRNDPRISINPHSLIFTLACCGTAIEPFTQTH